MDDHKRVPEDRKSSYVAPLVIAAVVIAIIALIAIRLPPPSTPSMTPPTAKAIIVKNPPKRSIPIALQALTREDLVKGGRQIAIAYADSGKLPDGADPLVGRRFSVRLAFGCNGLQGEAASVQATVNYDADNQSVTLTAQPGSWISLPQIQSLSNLTDIEAVDGFWIPRPWADREDCPPQMNYSLPATPTPQTAQTLGLAQIFKAGASRIIEHADKPYTFTRKLSADRSTLLNHSYRLVLEGVITGFADGRAIHCWVEAADHAPVCLYAVSFDHIAFEDGDTGEILANWNN